MKYFEPFTALNPAVSANVEEGLDPPVNACGYEEGKVKESMAQKDIAVLLLSSICPFGFPSIRYESYSEVHKNYKNPASSSR